MLLLVTAKEIWLSFHDFTGSVFMTPQNSSTLFLSKERDRSEVKNERKQNRLRGFNICVKENCHCHPVVIQHDKLKRECYYTLAQKRKKRCHIQNRKQES